MTGNATVRLGSLCEFLNGGTPDTHIDRFFQGHIPWITGADITTPTVTNARSFITHEAVHSSATNLVPVGTVLLVTRTSVGKVGIAGVDLCFSQDITALTPDKRRLHAPYLAAFLRSQEGYLTRMARGATIKGVTRDVVADLRVPIRSIPEQMRIADLLGRADTLHAKRRAALVQVDTLTQAIFLDLFGDPASNPNGWTARSLGEVATKFSDGPFGSNLKTCHYTDCGIRVIRLQNIGVGVFDDDDRAYVSETHFGELRKHECRAGDVLIGTLGDPNLRACIQPEWLPIALNKADCVQMRPKEDVANSEYLSALLNLPATERMAQALLRGQTRVRISMGRLRGLMVPIPPINLQHEFARRIRRIENMRASQCSSATELDALFASLQHRAFRVES